MSEEFKTPDTEAYKIGEWVRVRFPNGTEIIGEIENFRVDRAGQVEAAIIKNAVWSAIVTLPQITERVDPVEEWNRIMPGQPLPDYLKSRLALE